MDDTAEIIARASDMEITELLCLILQRYSNLHPDTRPVFFTLPKDDPEQCQQIMNRLMQLLTDQS